MQPTLGLSEPWRMQFHQMSTSRAVVPTGLTMPCMIVLYGSDDT